MFNQNLSDLHQCDLTQFFIEKGYSEVEAFNIVFRYYAGFSLFDDEVKVIESWLANAAAH